MFAGETGFLAPGTKTSRRGVTDIGPPRKSESFTKGLYQGSALGSIDASDWSMHRKDGVGRKFFNEVEQSCRFEFTRRSDTRRKPCIARRFQNGPAVNRLGTPVGCRKVAVQVYPVRVTTGAKRHAVGICAKDKGHGLERVIECTEATTQEKRCLGFFSVDSSDNQQTARASTGNIAKRRSESRATVFRKRKEERGTHRNLSSK